MKRFNDLLIEMGSSVLILAALVPQPSIAADVPCSSYETMAIGNRAFGTLVVNGNYQEAIDRITGRVSRHYPFSAPNNLCVAHTALGQFADAIPFCDKAVEVAEWQSGPGPRRLKGRAQMATITALAYSNRGVLRALSGDKSGAEEDFRAAIELKGDMRAPIHNFARLSMGSYESFAVIISASSHPETVACSGTRPGPVQPAVDFPR